MKQLMELLGLDIPKWEGPTLCESSNGAATDAKPPRAFPEKKTKVKREPTKGERKRDAPALTDDGSVKEETASVKRERADSPVQLKEEK